MNLRRPFVTGLSLAACLLAAAAEPAAPARSAPPGLTPRFKQVRERIDALYQYRNHAPPPPAPEENPFRAAFTPALARGAGEPAPADAKTADVSAVELATLQEAAATLHVSGILENQGQLHLVINKRAYKVGEVVPASVDGQTVYLRVRDIGRNRVTLALNESEMTLSFGPPPRKAEK